MDCFFYPLFCRKGDRKMSTYRQQDTLVGYDGIHTYDTHVGYTHTACVRACVEDSGRGGGLMHCSLTHTLLWGRSARDIVVVFVRACKHSQSSVGWCGFFFNPIVVYAKTDASVFCFLPCQRGDYMYSSQGYSKTRCQTRLVHRNPEMRNLLFSYTPLCFSLAVGLSFIQQCQNTELTWSQSRADIISTCSG